MKRLPFILLGLAIILGAYGVALYNSLQRADESVNAAWSEVVNQYQRRADLVPNLVETVKGYAKHEQTLLTEITAARARVSSMAPTPEMLSDATALERYRAAQTAPAERLALAGHTDDAGHTADAFSETTGMLTFLLTFVAACLRTRLRIVLLALAGGGFYLTGHALPQVLTIVLAAYIVAGALRGIVQGLMRGESGGGGSDDDDDDSGGFFSTGSRSSFSSFSSSSSSSSSDYSGGGGDSAGGGAGGT